jgi:hypothetical protein
MPGFQNVDPRLYTASAQVMMNLPFNEAKTNLLYLMGGAGAYMFDRVGESSTLNNRMGDSDGQVTKLGLTAGAGLEFRILGATSLFVRRVHERSRKKPGTPGSSGNLRGTSWRNYAAAAVANYHRGFPSQRQQTGARDGRSHSTRHNPAGA